LVYNLNWNREKRRMTKIIKLSEEAINEAVLALLNDGIVIIPTIRWYMICCKAESSDCVERIFNAKKRSFSKQPLFILPDKIYANFYFKIGGITKLLINELWPGELSILLLWKNKNMASKFKAINQSYALVCNPPGIFGSVVNKISIPLAATTVNVSSSLEKNCLGPAISLKEITSFINKTGIKIDVIIDGGICTAFNHTTIIDCRKADQAPKIIREGFVHERAINAVLYSKS